MSGTVLTCIRHLSNTYIQTDRHMYTYTHECIQWKGHSVDQIVIHTEFLRRKSQGNM